MKTLTKLLIAGGTLAATGVANAAIITNLPPATGGSDLVLFVTDNTTQTSFVQDLGVNVDSLGLTTANVLADYAAGNQYNVDGLGVAGALGTGGPVTIASGILTGGVDNALLSFTSTAGNHEADSFTYTITGASVTGGTYQPGDQRYVGAYTAANGNTLFNADAQSTDVGRAQASTDSWFSGINGSTSKGFGIAGGDGLGQNAPGFMAGALSGANITGGVGTAVYLYETATFTGGNDANVYASADEIVVNANGTITGLTSSPSAVPLPAAIWLLGSGVLGLFGIGRRRATA